MQSHGLLIAFTSLAAVTLLAGCNQDTPMAPHTMEAGTARLTRSSGFLASTAGSTRLDVAMQSDTDCVQPTIVQPATIVPCDGGGGGGDDGGSRVGSLNPVTVLSPYYDRNTPGQYTLTASVSGGVGPYHYYWYRNICYDDGLPYLDCTGYESYLDGVGLGSVTINSYSNMRLEAYEVQVADAENVPATGDGSINLIGPYTGDKPLEYPTCIPDDENIYPFPDFQAPDWDHTKWYRVNQCNRHIEYQPVTDTTAIH